MKRNLYKTIIKIGRQTKLHLHDLSSENLGQNLSDADGDLFRKEIWDKIKYSRKDPAGFPREGKLLRTKGISISSTDWQRS